MKIVTWNVNSVRQRIPRLVALLDRHRPDVVCLQETKVVDDDFPTAEVEAAGYRVASFGQRTYNGVATLSRTPAGRVERGFPGDPVSDQARVLLTEHDGLTVVNLYVVNGQRVGSDKYAVKLAWLDAVAAWLESTAAASQPLVVTGDFNVAPEDIDVHDPELWRGKILCSEPERQRVRSLEALGLADLQRLFTKDGGLYTWWDYRAGAFHRGWGLRIDLALGSPPVASRLAAVAIDREERKKSTGEGSPSDHAPVVVTLN
jgi:exodeoxyribonuclease-3